MTTDGVEKGRSGREAARLAAVRLMRLALPLLDRAGNHRAAAQLRYAIDLSGEDTTSSEEVLPPLRSEGACQHPAR